MIARILVCLAAATAAARAMEITSQGLANVKTIVHSVIFNRNVGDQAPSSITAPLLYTANEDVCAYAVANAAIISGSIVMLDKSDLQLWDLPADVRSLKCLEDVGAVAGVNAYNLIVEPGMGFRLFNEPSEVQIPLFHVALKAFPPDVLTEIKAITTNTSVNATIFAQKNAWIDMWESTSYKVVWQITLPVLNAASVVMAAVGVVLLGRLLRVNDNQPGPLTNVRRFNIRLLITGNVIMLFTSVARLYYCLGGPLYESKTRTMAFHFILLNITIVWEVIASIIAIAIFIRWASFGIPPKERLFNKILGIMALAGFPIYLIITVMDLMNIHPITAVLQPTLMTIASVIVCLVYTYRTVVFIIRTWRSRRKGTSYNSRMRIGLLMLFAAAMNVLMCIGLLMTLHPTYFFTVQGRFVVYAVLFFGLTLQALAQIMAFLPTISPFRHANVAQTKMKMMGLKKTFSFKTGHSAMFTGRSLRKAKSNNTKAPVDTPGVSRRKKSDAMPVTPQVVYPDALASPSVRSCKAVDVEKGNAARNNDDSCNDNDDNMSTPQSVSRSTALDVDLAVVSDRSDGSETQAVKAQQIV